MKPYRTLRLPALIVLLTALGFVDTAVAQDGRYQILHDGSVTDSGRTHRESILRADRFTGAVKVCSLRFLSRMTQAVIGCRDYRIQNPDQSVPTVPNAGRPKFNFGPVRNTQRFWRVDNDSGDVPAGKNVGK